MTIIFTFQWLPPLWWRAQLSSKKKTYVARKQHPAKKTLEAGGELAQTVIRFEIPVTRARIRYEKRRHRWRRYWQWSKNWPGCPAKRESRNDRTRAWKLESASNLTNPQVFLFFLFFWEERKRWDWPFSAQSWLCHESNFGKAAFYPFAKVFHRLSTPEIINLFWLLLILVNVFASKLKSWDSPSFHSFRWLKGFARDLQKKFPPFFLEVDRLVFFQNQLLPETIFVLVLIVTLAWHSSEERMFWQCFWFAVCGFCQDVFLNSCGKVDVSL